MALFAVLLYSAVFYNSIVDVRVRITHVDRRCTYMYILCIGVFITYIYFYIIIVHFKKRHGNVFRFSRDVESSAYLYTVYLCKHLYIYNICLYAYNNAITTIYIIIITRANPYDNI